MKKNRMIIYNITLLLLVILMLVVFFIRDYFGAISLDQILFHIFAPINEPIGNFFAVGIKYGLPKLILLILLYIFIKYIFDKILIVLEVKVFNKFININLNSFLYKIRWLFIFGFFLMIGNILNKNFDIINVIKSNISSSNFYEEYYIDPKNVNISFPKEKRNLIYIFVESLETTEFSKNSGGYRKNSIIPELEKLASDNINFSHNDNLGGFDNVSGTDFTVGAIIGNTAGVPLKSIGGIHVHNFQLYGEILKRAYSIGEILEGEGYKNYFMIGSDKKFGGRGKYLNLHGNYEVFDFTTARELKYIENDYDINWWGYEDKKLYQYAKEKLIEISKKEEPFNFSMLTVDTHPFGGYLDETCNIYKNLTQYENVFLCGSKMLNEFINWIKKQQFYKNTTIVIVGDHLNMVNEGIHDNMPNDFDRKAYNVFINSKMKTKCSKNRIFTILDMYPSTLVALGAKIEGERLALGTNLFSCKETLAEEMGIVNFNNELQKKSSYYDYCLFLGECNK